MEGTKYYLSRRIKGPPFDGRLSSMVQEKCLKFNIFKHKKNIASGKFCWFKNGRTAQLQNNFFLTSYGARSSSRTIPKKGQKKVAALRLGEKDALGRLVLACHVSVSYIHVTTSYESTF